MMRKAWFAGLWLAFTPTLYKQTVITLKNSFIEQFKNRVTIDATFTVGKTSKIHPASQDGDIHIAGTAPEIELAAVAEIMNAKLERNAAVKKIEYAFSWSRTKTRSPDSRRTNPRFTLY